MSEDYKINASWRNFGLFFNRICLFFLWLFIAMSMSWMSWITMSEAHAASGSTITNYHVPCRNGNAGNVTTFHSIDQSGSGILDPARRSYDFRCGSSHGNTTNPDVFSPTRGVVFQAVNSSNWVTSRVLINDPVNSACLVILHIENIRVSAGDQVHVGMLLGSSHQNSPGRHVHINALDIYPCNGSLVGSNERPISWIEIGRVLPANIGISQLVPFVSSNPTMVPVGTPSIVHPSPGQNFQDLEVFVSWQRVLNAAGPSSFLRYRILLNRYDGARFVNIATQFHNNSDRACPGPCSVPLATLPAGRYSVKVEAGHCNACTTPDNSNFTPRVQSSVIEFTISAPDLPEDPSDPTDPTPSDPPEPSDPPHDDDVPPLPDDPVCEDLDPEGDLTGYLVIVGGIAEGYVSNGSDTCEYTVGIASYLKFDDIIDNQELFYGYEGVVISPGATIGPEQLQINLPDCATQIDLFYGALLLSLNGERYGERLLDARHVHNSMGFCQRQQDF